MNKIYEIINEIENCLETVETVIYCLFVINPWLKPGVNRIINRFQPL